MSIQASAQMAPSPSPPSTSSPVESSDWPTALYRDGPWEGSIPVPLLPGCPSARISYPLARIPKSGLPALRPVDRPFPLAAWPASRGTSDVGCQDTQRPEKGQVPAWRRGRNPQAGDRFDPPPSPDPDTGDPVSTGEGQCLSN